MPSMLYIYIFKILSDLAKKYSYVDLPQEIVIQIFEFLYSPAKETSNLNANHPIKVFSLTKCMHICQYWRKIW